jgi:hypothetical protein
MLENGNNIHVIGSLNIKTRQLNILDFYSKLEIRSIFGYEEGNLIIHTESNNSEKHYFYMIPFG